MRCSQAQHLLNCVAPWTLCRYPPESDGSRKYMAVFWDHGNGWLGYGADGKCSSTAQYTDHVYCSVASLAVLTQGECNISQHDKQLQHACAAKYGLKWPANMRT
jgi:hypothetical protein